MNKDSEVQDQGLLDLLVVVARHIRLLLLVPIAVGAVAFGLASIKPASYTSEAILTLPEATARQAAMIMTTPLVLDTVIRKLGLAKDVPLHEAREALASQVRAKVGKEGLLWLMVSASSPAQAQALANHLIDAWRVSTIPGANETEELQQRLAYVQKTLKSVDQLLARLTSESPSYFDGQLTRGDRGLTLVSLGELQARYFNEAQSIPRTLMGVSRDVVKQDPTLPALPDGKGKTKTAILMATITLLLLLIGLLLSHLIGRAMRSPVNVQAVARLRAALGSGKPKPAPYHTPPGG